MYLPIVLGTAREGRRSEVIANKLAELLTGMGIGTDIFDVKDSLLTATKGQGNDVFFDNWLAALDKAVGFLIVVPEYNHGYPGELKLFLDQFKPEYDRKIVGIVSVANGLWGGTRVTEQLRPVLAAFNMIVLGMAIHLRNVGSMIEQGEYNNPEFPDFVELMVSQIKDLGYKLSDSQSMEILS